MFRGKHSLAVIALHVGLLSCLLAVTRADAATLFKGRKATPQLPLDDSRLRRNDDAGAHTPEQVICYF